MRDVDVISREYVEKELKIHNIPGMAIGVIKDDKIIKNNMTITDENQTVTLILTGIFDKNLFIFFKNIA